MPDNSFRFAVALGAETSPAELRETARLAEDLGYSMLLCSDHLHQRLSPLAAATAALACTSRLEVGTYVLNCDFRNPRVLAREVQAVHDLGDGRFTVGLGAGWLRGDYSLGEIPFAPGPARAENFARVFGIVREHLDACAAAASRPRLLVGGGQRRMLTFAAQNADIVSVTPASTADGTLDEDDATAASYDQKYAWVRAAAGDRLPDIEINHVTWECFVTPRPERVVAALSAAMRLPEAAVREMPCMLVGSPDELVETLLARRERWGVSLISVPAQAVRAFGPVVAKLG